MSNDMLVWLIIGAGLIIAELTTGTLYLLVVGLAAWAGAATAYVSQGLSLQLIAAGVAALVGLAILIPYDIRRRAHALATNVDQEVGNDVTVEMISAGDKIRVHYRGSTWEATPEGGFPSTLKQGDVCVITAVRGNTLVIRPRG